MAETAEYDRLTGLPTLRHLEQYLEQLSREQESFGLLLLDIDSFMLFNDAYGHIQGDALLQKLSDAFREAATEEVRVFRSAGDKFTVFWHGKTKAEIIPLAIQLRAFLNRELAKFPLSKRLCRFHDGRQLEYGVPVTVSGCILFYPTHGRTFAELESEALDAMYRGGRRSHPGGVLVLGDYQDISLVTGPAN